jgi:hypothetical protein
MRDYLEIGPCPAEEEAAQLGTDGFDAANKAECLQFIKAIKRVCGEPPEGASLAIKSNSHDYGIYREVIVRFDPEDRASTDYAFMVEEKAPTTWAEAKMDAPVAGRAR